MGTLRVGDGHPGVLAVLSVWFASVLLVVGTFLLTLRMLDDDDR